MRTTVKLAVAALVLALVAADWPQYRGPNRDAISKETGLLKEWPKGGPELLWTFDKAGIGLAGPALVGGKLYTMGMRDGMEYVLALDDTGAELWAAKIAPGYDFKGNSFSAGPLGTPSVDGDSVYAVGSQGMLVCMDAAKGMERWHKDLKKELGGVVNPIQGGPWGFTWSPLVDGDRLIIAPGGPKGLLAALNKKTGEVVWQSKEITEPVTYSSPIASDAGGVRQYVQVVQSGVVGVAASDGKLLWHYKREDPFPDVVCPTPIAVGDQVYVTAGWSAGSELLKLTKAGDKFTVASVWDNKDLSNRNGGVVLVGGHLYGYDDTNSWKCLELASGKETWASKKLGPGSLIYADGNLYCLAEDTGIVALVEASPEGYKEKARFKLSKQSTQRKPRERIWTHPVIADGKLYLRDQEFIFCYKIK
jgi:outer membrane protein assembly factor BamB